MTKIGAINRVFLASLFALPSAVSTRRSSSVAVSFSAQTEGTRTETS